MSGRNNYTVLLNARLGSGASCVCARAQPLTPIPAFPLTSLPDTRTSASYTQAAWRFLNNPRVTLPERARPLLSAAGPLLDEHCKHYGLTMHDWPRINFGGHKSKTDQRKMTHKTDAGYDLQRAVLVSDVSGKPLAPVVQPAVGGGTGVAAVARSG